MKRYSIILVAGLLAMATSRAEENEWRNFMTPSGRMVEAKVVTVDINGVRLQLRKGKALVDVPFGNLNPADLTYVQNWEFSGEPSAEPGRADKGVPGGAGDDLYPRKRGEVEKLLEKIKDRDAEGGLDRQVQKAVNELNVYRFLCGVSWGVTGEENMSEAAERAARQFVEEGEKSKEIDKKENKFLWEEGEEDMEDVLRVFIADEKRDNRDTMPMRARVLSPGLSRTGFGKWENVVAMRVGLPSGSGPEMWSYPGRGYFPHEYLHGDQWSVYVDFRIPDPEKVQVRMWELSSAPDAAFEWEKAVPGDPVRISRVAVEKNAVHFEPAKPGKKSIYWVRVTGPRMQEQYLVHFY